MIFLPIFGLVCGFAGWVLCDWRHDVIETRAFWASRPHITGIECPPETNCEVCYG